MVNAAYANKGIVWYIRMSIVLFPLQSPAAECPRQQTQPSFVSFSTFSQIFEVITKPQSQRSLQKPNNTLALLFFPSFSFLLLAQPWLPRLSPTSILSLHNGSPTTLSLPALDRLLASPLAESPSRSAPPLTPTNSSKLPLVPSSPYHYFLCSWVFESCFGF